MELKEFKEDFSNNLEMFNQGLTKYIKSEKPNNKQIQEYSKEFIKWYYPNANNNILQEIENYSEHYLQLHNIKQNLQKELFKIYKSKQTLQKEFLKIK